MGEAEADRQRAAKKAEIERRKKEAAANDLKKAGPRDIGKVKYKGTKMDQYDDSDLLMDRPSSFVKRKSKEVVIPEKKLGPRDVGKIKYKGTKLDVDGNPVKGSKKKKGHRSSASSSSNASMQSID